MVVVGKPLEPFEQQKQHKCDQHSHNKQPPTTERIVTRHYRSWFETAFEWRCNAIVSPTNSTATIPDRELAHWFKWLRKLKIGISRVKRQKFKRLEYKILLQNLWIKTCLCWINMLLARFWVGKNHSIPFDRYFIDWLKSLKTSLHSICFSDVLSTRVLSRLLHKIYILVLNCLSKVKINNRIVNLIGWKSMKLCVKFFWLMKIKVITALYFKREV